MSDKPKRYDPTIYKTKGGPQIHMRKLEDGEWVAYTQYKVLQEENKQLREELDTQFRFSIPDHEDSVYNLVLDYNISQWLHAQGYYSKFELKDDAGTAPILTALKECEKKMDSNENKLLMNILTKRIKSTKH